MERDLAADVHAVLTTTLSAMAGLAPDGEVVRSGPVVATYFGGHFSRVMVWEDGPRLDEDLRAVVEYGVARGVPLTLTVAAGSAPEATVTRWADDAGFVEKEQLPGMALAALDSIPSAPYDLKVEQVRDPREMAVVTEVTAASFELSADFAAAISGPHMLEHRDIHWLVARRDGEPLGVGMLALVADVAGVFSVGVPPAGRRAGIGTAITWEAIRLGRELGARTAALEATPMGEPVYLQMGFETVSEIRFFKREHD